MDRLRFMDSTGAAGLLVVVPNGVRRLVVNMSLPPRVAVMKLSEVEQAARDNTLSDDSRFRGIDRHRAKWLASAPAENAAPVDVEPGVKRDRACSVIGRKKAGLAGLIESRMRLSRKSPGDQFSGSTKMRPPRTGRRQPRSLAGGRPRGIRRRLRERVGPAERVDERAERIQGPAGEHEQRGGDADLTQELRATTTPAHPSATPITAEIHFGASIHRGRWPKTSPQPRLEDDRCSAACLKRRCPLSERLLLTSTRQRFRLGPSLGFRLNRRKSLGRGFLAGIVQVGKPREPT